jgi:shikimate dehydrogenase
LGAGGSARALARALVREAWTVRIHNRTVEKANVLAHAVGASVIDEPDPTGANLILNTTSASLVGEDLPVLWDRAEAGALAYDLAYGGEATPFLKAAATRGLATMDGLPMLVQQGALALEWWIGANPPLEVMMQAAMAPPPEAE